MKSNLIPIFFSLFILAAAVIMPAAAGQTSTEKIPVIIGFKEKPDAALVKAHGGEIKYQYHTIPAIAVSLPEQAINALKNNPNVAYVEQDAEVYITKRPVTPVIQPPEKLPWRVDRIDAELVHNAYTGSGVKVAVIDTGIDYTHPDLADNYMGGYDFVNDDSYPMDDNGHGTHVAGTIAASDNDIGVIGVAPNADLYALKALNKRGSGYLSDIDAAIDWAIKNNMDIISMSLGGGYSKSQEALCQKAYEAGIVIVAAAGNEAGAVIYPAAYSSVIAVSATDSSNKIAYFSNFGDEVELAAPGVNISSTYPGGKYTTLSGTSMATPHVTGTVALLLSTNIADYDNTDDNGDGLWDPVEVRSRLQSTAKDLGATGVDYYYGYGLVNAKNALGL